GVDRDLVGNATGDQLLQRPDQVRQVDTVHGRAVTHRTVEEGDVLVRMRVRQPPYQVELGAHGPRRTGRRRLDGSDDVLGRTHVVGRGHHVVPALGVHEHVDPGHPLANLVDAAAGEPAVDRAVAAPQDHLRVAQLLGGETTVRLVRVVEHTVIQRHA